MIRSKKKAERNNTDININVFIAKCIGNANRNYSRFCNSIACAVIAGILTKFFQLLILYSQYSVFL